MKSTVWMVIFILTLVASGIVLNNYWVPRAPLAFATVAAGVVTFFYFVPPNGNAFVDEGRMRGAIASAIIIQYLVIVGFVAYFSPGDAKELSRVDAIAAMLIPSFTSIVGVVIAFYFGASAYVEAKKNRQNQEGNDVKKGDAAFEKGAE